MNSKNTLSILVRRDVLSKDEWSTLVEIRRRIIAENARSMTVLSVGELKIVRDHFGDHALSIDDPFVLGDNGLDLRTRLILLSGHQVVNGYVREEIKKIWGLTRNGVWITIEVQIISGERFSMRDDCTHNVATAERVTLKTVDFEGICHFSGLGAMDIWMQMSAVIKSWAEHRRQLYETARVMASRVGLEEEILGSMPGVT